MHQVEGETKFLSRGQVTCVWCSVVFFLVFSEMAHIGCGSFRAIGIIEVLLERGFTGAYSNRIIHVYIPKRIEFFFLLILPNWDILILKVRSAHTGSHLIKAQIWSIAS